MGMPVNDALTREFSRRLYKLMTDGGMSQSDLARKIWGETDDPRGFKVAKNRDRISQYLRGRSLPDPENSLKIAEALGVAVEDLIPGGRECRIRRRMSA